MLPNDLFKSLLLITKMIICGINMHFIWTKQYVCQFVHFCAACNDLFSYDIGLKGWDCVMTLQF